MEPQADPTNVPRDGVRRVRRRKRSIDRGRRSRERARAELEAAILLVAGGHFPRVLVSNIADCAGAVDDLRGLAEATGVDLQTLPRNDGRGCDIAITAR